MNRNKLYLTMLATTVVIPALAVSVTQVEAKGTVVLASNPFRDVSVNNPYYNIIHEMQDTGIIRGFEDSTFRPNTTLSRAHAASLISRALQFNELTLEKTVDFVQPKDLTTANPYYEDIKMLIEARLIETDSKGNINPSQELTRGEMAKIIAVAFNLKVKADYVFEDVKGSKYEEYVKALYSNGVTTGYEDCTFKLDGSLTRMHYVLFMHRAMNLDEEFVAKPILAPKPMTEPTPTPIPPPKPDANSSIKYSDWSRNDIKTKIPRPAGYVAEIHEKQNAKYVKEIMAENGHGYQASFTIEANSSYWDSSFTFEDALHLYAEHAGTTYKEFVKIVNQVIETGEVYNEKTFTVYFDYQKGMIYLTGVRNHAM